jgi:hypothetical protein
MCAAQVLVRARDGVEQQRGTAHVAGERAHRVERRRVRDEPKA